MPANRRRCQDVEQGLAIRLEEVGVVAHATEELPLIALIPAHAKLEDVHALPAEPETRIAAETERGLGRRTEAWRQVEIVRVGKRIDLIVEDVLVIEGRKVVVARNGDKVSVLGEKVPETPVPQVWLERVGGYELLNPDDEYPLVEPTLKVHDGHLCMSYKLPKLSAKTIQVPLQPISDTEAIILGLGRTRGETLRVISVDGEERLRYSGFVGEKLEKRGQ